MREAIDEQKRLTGEQIGLLNQSRTTLVQIVMRATGIAELPGELQWRAIKDPIASYVYDSYRFDLLLLDGVDRPPTSIDDLAACLNVVFYPIKAA